MENSPARTVFIISDSTGITAETFSHSVLSQFSGHFNFRFVREPFVTTAEKAQLAAQKIQEAAEKDNIPPIVFSTLVDASLQPPIKAAGGIFLDVFGTVVAQLEDAMGIKSTPFIGKSHASTDSEEYQNRMEAINFTLQHDDGQYIQGLETSDIILVGVSRCGKTPTSLYLAMQYGIRCANFPLIPEDFDRGALPATLRPFRKKLFGLSIDPYRLSAIRNERRPDSKYASLDQCMHEVDAAERMMRMEGIRFLSSTQRSIEEISTTIMHVLGLDQQ